MAGAKVDTKSAQIWIDSISKENQLRLKWFMRNKDQLVESCKETPYKKSHAEELKEEIDDERVQIYRKAKRFSRPKPEELPIPEIDPDAYFNIMKPVDPKTTAIIYQTNQKNRVTYLKERCKILPENRYYFPETTSYQYGWNMFYYSKTNPIKKYGVIQILRDTFYRRNNVGRDPDSYRETAQYNPTVCNCS